MELQYPCVDNTDLYNVGVYTCSGAFQPHIGGIHHHHPHKHSIPDSRDVYGLVAGKTVAWIDMYGLI